MALPLVYGVCHLAHECLSTWRGEAKLLALRQRVVQCGLGAPRAYHHGLVAQVLQAGHHIKCRGQFVVTVKTQAQAMVALMVVGVVHQDVEHHAFEQLFAHGGLAVRVAQAQQHRGECAVALGQACGPQHSVGRQAMQPQRALPVKALDRQRVARLAVAWWQRQQAGGRNRDARRGGQGHGGVLDARCVYRVVQLAELHHTRAVGRLQQGLGPRTAQGHTGLHQALDLRRDGRLLLHGFHRLGQLGQVAKLRVGADAPRDVLLCRHRNAQRPKPVIARKQQHLQHRQSGRAVNVPDDALAPAVRPRIVQCAGYAAALPHAEVLPCNQRQVFA